MSLIDCTVLERLLSGLDEAFRKSLLAQMVADLERLENGLKAEPQDRRAAIAHEIKGLSATIGAMPVAELAELVQMSDNRADTDAQCEQLRSQISAICASLSRKARQGDAR